MEEEFKRLKIITLIFMMVTFGGLIYNNSKINNLKAQVNQEGIYDYCVEWDGWIYREHLFFNCYDIETREIGCKYEITKTNDLKVYSFSDNLTITYLCSRFLKSTKVVNYAE